MHKFCRLNPWLTGCMYDSGGNGHCSSSPHGLQRCTASRFEQQLRAGRYRVRMHVQACNCSVLVHLRAESDMDAGGCNVQAICCASRSERGIHCSGVDGRSRLHQRSVFSDRVYDWHLNSPCCIDPHPDDIRTARTSNMLVVHRFSPGEILSRCQDRRNLRGSASSLAWPFAVAVSLIFV